MLISNVHKSIIVMNSLDTRFSRNGFEVVQKTRSTCKHCCSCFKHYNKITSQTFSIPKSNKTLPSSYLLLLTLALLPLALPSNAWTGSSTTGAPRQTVRTRDLILSPYPARTLDMTTSVPFLVDPSGPFVVFCYIPRERKKSYSTASQSCHSR